MASRSEAGEAVRAVLIGRPNAGKSSLFNALARDAGALVSELPGTTRDYLTAEIDLDGVKCQLIDTAGIEAGPDADRSGRRIEPRRRTGGPGCRPGATPPRRRADPLPRFDPAG